MKNKQVEFSEDERAAMKARALEIKTQERSNKSKASGEKHVAGFIRHHEIDSRRKS